jgi:PTS system mannose-specific IIB component
VSVVLARVDDRLVHGQVVEGWVPHVSAEIVVIASDEVYQDRSRSRLLALIVPDYVHLIIVPLKELRQVLKEKDSSKTLLLFEDLDDVLAVLQFGVTLDRVNLGNLHHVRGGIEVTPAVYLNRKDIQLVRELSEKGVLVEARDVPDSKPCDLMEFIIRAEGMI